jgi:membrane fusion protein, multidrug efflux system
MIVIAIGQALMSLSVTALPISMGAPIAVSLLVLAAGCSPQAPTATDVVRPVQTMLVSAGGDTNVRSFPGRVEASKQVELAFQVSGLLVSLPVREGKSVAKNDVIGQLRQDEFQARLGALQGQLDRARADLQALLSRGHGPRRDCDWKRRCGRPRRNS